MILTGAKYRTPYNVVTLRSAYLRRYFDNPHVHALKVGNQQGVDVLSLFTRFRKVAQKCRPGERAVHEQSDPSCAALFAGGARTSPLASARCAEFFRCASLANAVRSSSCCSACTHVLCVHTHAPRPHAVQPASTSSRLAGLWPRICTFAIFAWLPSSRAVLLEQSSSRALYTC